MKPTAAPQGPSPRPRPAGWADPAVLAASCARLDGLRRMQGNALAALGLGPRECRHSVVARGRLWRLRDYGGAGDGPPLLIVAAPIKHPYVWDLRPSVSVVRRCLAAGLRVFLLEWLPASRGTADAGLEAYAGQALAEAVAEISRRTDGAKPVLMGHSLGGTFAAIHGALAGDSLSGLVLLSAPLCFAPGSGRFRDALVSLLPDSLAAIDVVPGSLLTGICVWAAPDIFVWSRAADAGLGLTDPEALAVQAGVERWSLDELPLSGRLVREIFEQLYREDRLCRGRLEIAGRRLGPAALRLPTLAAVNAADGIAPPASVRPFVDSLPTAPSRVLAYEGEAGVGLQHLAVLLGRKAHAQLWPQIIEWLRAQT